MRKAPRGFVNGCMLLLIVLIAAGVFSFQYIHNRALDRAGQDITVVADYDQTIEKRYRKAMYRLHVPDSEMADSKLGDLLRELKKGPVERFDEKSQTVEMHLRQAIEGMNGLPVPAPYGEGHKQVAQGVGALWQALVLARKAEAATEKEERRAALEQSIKRYVAGRNRVQSGKSLLRSTGPDWSTITDDD